MRITSLLLCLILLLALLACTPENQLTDNTTHLVQPPPPAPIRPDIPRVPLPEESPAPTQTSPAAQQYSFLNTTLLTRPAEPGGLFVGTEENPFLVGDLLGERLPYLTRNELSILAMRQPSGQGLPLEADTYVRFDFDEETSGELRFERDLDTDELRSELFFEEGAPIFEYAYLLRKGAFPGMVNEPFDFFGHTYVIREAFNRSITLYGQDVEQYLSLVDGNQLRINGDAIAHTRVSVDPWSIIIRYEADDQDDGGLSIKPGESLRDKMKRPEALLNPLFDIAYEGLDTRIESVISLQARKRAIRLSFTNILGEEQELDVLAVENGSLVWGEEDGRLHVKECSSLSNYCIRIGERFPLTTRDGVTRIFEFRSVNPQGTDIVLEEVASGEEHFVRVADTDRTKDGKRILDGAIDLGESLFRMRILHDDNDSANDTLSIDFDATGGLSGEDVELLTSSLVEITFHEGENGSMWLRCVLPRRTILGEQLDEEVLWLQGSLVDGEPVVGIAGLNLSASEDDKRWQGMTERGTLVTLDESDDGDEASFAYAPGFRSGLVRIIG